MYTRAFLVQSETDENIPAISRASGGSANCRKGMSLGLWAAPPAAVPRAELPLGSLGAKPQKLKPMTALDASTKGGGAPIAPMPRSATAGVANRSALPTTCIKLVSVRDDCFIAVFKLLFFRVIVAFALNCASLLLESSIKYRLLERRIFNKPHARETRVRTTASQGYGLSDVLLPSTLLNSSSSSRSPNQ